jgi:hypothetical protein
MHPPDLEMRRAPLQERPDRKADFNKLDETTEAVTDFQAEKLRRLYFFCRATACTIAALAFAVSR